MTQVITTIPRLYSGIAQWAACLIYLLAYYRKLRFDRVRFSLLAAAALVLQCAEMVLTDNLDGVLWVLGMIGAVLIMYLFLLLGSTLSLPSAAYCVVRAFVLSELAASVEWQLYFYYKNGDVLTPGASRVVFMLVVFAAVFAVAFLLEHSVTRDGQGAAVQMREFAAVLVIGIMVFFISNLSFVSDATPFSASAALEIYNIRTFVDLGGMAVLFAYHMMHRELNARYEVQAIQSVLEAHYDQYKLSRESIELINRKYHDLKLQIPALRNSTEQQRRNA